VFKTGRKEIKRIYVKDKENKEEVAGDGRRIKRENEERRNMKQRKITRNGRMKGSRRTRKAEAYGEQIKRHLMPLVRVPGYTSRSPGLIPGATRFSEK
jgi:hypothetical protein